jgi:hypothetical protein
MPPGPAYNWLCVLHSTAEILSHAARYRAAQIVPRSTLHSRKRRRTEETACVDHVQDLKSSEHEPILYASSIQNVDIQTVCSMLFNYNLSLIAMFLGLSDNINPVIRRT